MSNWKEIAISLAVVIVGVVVATVLYKQAEKLGTKSSNQDHAEVTFTGKAA
jgi:uncharacterized membrane protein